MNKDVLSLWLMRADDIGERGVGGRRFTSAAQAAAAGRQRR